MDHFIKFWLHNRLLTILAAILLMVIGSYILVNRPIDVLPSLDRSVVGVITEAHGMVPEDVEQLISSPLERAFNGAPMVTRVRSSSGQGLSIVFVEFSWTSDMNLNRQVVAEKLQVARSTLPNTVTPLILPSSSIMGQIQKIGLYSKTGETNLETLTKMVELDLSYKLIGVSGVAKTIAIGGLPQQIQIMPDVTAMQQLGINYYEIAAAISSSNQNTEGGFIEVGSSSPMISYRGRYEKIEDVENQFIATKEGRPVFLKDVAKVKLGPSLMRLGYAGVNGKEGVIISILKQPNADTKSITKEVDRLLEEYQKILPSDVVIVNNLFKQSDFIDRAIQNVMDAVRDGVVLVIIVLFLFLANFRSTLIALVAMPLSVAVAAILFAFLEIGINTMTLGGLAVAVGALVDDAIVGMENCLRRLKLAKVNGETDQAEVARIVLEAIKEIRNPVLIGTIIVALVYLPLFFLEGMEGRLFMPIGVTYVISILCSYLVAIIFTPAMCLMLLPKVAEKQGHHETKLVVYLKSKVEALAKFSMQNAYTVIVALLLSVAGSVFLLTRMGTQFLPTFNEGVAQINVVMPPATSLEFTAEVAGRLEEIITSFEGVQSISRTVGRAENDEHVDGANVAEFIVTFKNTASSSKDAMLDAIRQESAKKLPGVNLTMDQPLQHLISHTISGVTAPIAIKVYGDDITTMRDIAQKIKEKIENISGIRDVFVEQLQHTKVLSIKPLVQALGLAGFEESQIRETIESTIGGEHLTQLIEGRQRIPVVLNRSEKQALPTIEEIHLMPIFNAEGVRYRIGDVAEVSWQLTPTDINHEDFRRRLVIQANTGDRSMGEIISDIKGVIAPIQESIKALKGYEIVVGGNYEAQESATKKITWLSLFSFTLMLGVLLIYYRSVSLSLQVMLALPTACVGAVVLLFLTDSIVSVATMVGFISLGGIAARNIIILIDHYIHLIREEGIPFGVELIIQASKDRMQPVLMTALASGIALIPLALSPNAPGKEILYPVAVVIIGGLISSTLLVFIVTPAFFWLYGEKAMKKLCKEEKE